MKQILKGDELMLFKNKKSIAYATSHVLTITGNTVDIEIGRASCRERV